jgi:molecular chaperone GrpE
MLNEKLENERARTRDYLNRLKYLQADFENYKKRTEKEIRDTRQYGSRSLILELLPVLDELEYALSAGEQDGEHDLLEGVTMIYRKLLKILEQEGLSKIPALEMPFDPHIHEAILQVPMEGKHGVILEEIRKGYMFRDIVLRPSLVKVAIDKAEEVKKEDE